MRKHIRVGNTEVTIEPIHVPEGEAFDPAAALEKIMHDCPECRAARDRGEQPQIFDLASLPAKRDVIRDRRPRWRKLKRKARR
jgi:hypothetical protein